MFAVSGLDPAGKLPLPVVVRFLFLFGFLPVRVRLLTAEDTVEVTVALNSGLVELSACIIDAASIH